MAPRPLLVTVLAVALQTSCQPTTSQLMPSPTAAATASATIPSACPSPVAAPSPQAVVSGQPAPDDLTFDGVDQLLFTDIKAGTVSRLASSGAVEQIGSGLQAPEGIVVLPDGRLLVAEQGRNRVVLLDQTTQAVTPWRTFPNPTANGGIDGIALDPSSSDVIVPDSPNGVVWRVHADGSGARRIGSGMVRPVGAAVDQQGAVIVADEGGALWKLTPPSQQRRIASLPVPDDVVVDHSGNLFVNTLGDNAIHMIGHTGVQTIFATGLRGPQGLALDGADNLYYTEIEAGRIARIVRTFLFDKPAIYRTDGGTVVICPSLERAAGYTDPLELRVVPAAGIRVVSLVQPHGDMGGVVELRRSPGAPQFVVIELRAGLLKIRQRVSVS